MEYCQFVESVKQCLEWKMESCYQVEVNPVTKNNSVVLDGVVIKKEGDKLAPNIYLNPYFERYLEGESVDEIASDIVCTYHQALTAKLAEEFEFDMSLEAMEGHIIFRLVNYEFNKELLKNLPYIRFLDLAVTFHCLVQQDYNGIGTIRVTKEQMKNWNITTRTLMKLAYENTQRLFPPKIRTMEEVIMEIISSGDREGGTEKLEELDYTKTLNEIKGTVNYNGQPPMYVLTNYSGINGATVLLYRELLAKLAEQLDHDFYILPSSIHEVIIVPACEDIHKEDLIEMVKDVNLTQVPEQEIMSNNVYYYEKSSGSFFV